MKVIILLLTMSSTATGCSSIAYKNATDGYASMEAAPVLVDASVGAFEAYKQELDTPTVYTYQPYVPLSEQTLHIRPVPNKQK